MVPRYRRRYRQDPMPSIDETQPSDRDIFSSLSSNPKRGHVSGKRRRGQGEDPDDAAGVSPTHHQPLDSGIEAQPTSRGSYYDSLGVDVSCSAAEIRKAYMDMARSTHPDRNSCAGAQSAFSAAAEAYRVLSDPEKRRRYDEGGQQCLRRMGCDTTDHQIRPLHVAEKALDILGNAGSLFEFINCQDRELLPAAPEPLQQRLQVSLEDLAFGASKKFMLRNREGEPEVLQVDLLPGWADQTRITFPGKGGSCPSSPGIQRDLVFVLQQVPHGSFTRQGDDLHATVRVPVLIGLCGGRVALPRLGSRPAIVLRIEPGMDLTSPLTIPRQGMPSSDGAATGDLIVSFSITLPPRLCDDKIQQLRELLGEPPSL